MTPTRRSSKTHVWLIVWSSYPDLFVTLSAMAKTKVGVPTGPGPRMYRAVPSALARAVTEGRKTDSFFFNAEDTMTYVSQDLNEATNLVWIYDDLLVGARSGSIIAFTPDRK